MIDNTKILKISTVEIGNGNIIVGIETLDNLIGLYKRKIEILEQIGSIIFKFDRFGIGQKNIDDNYFLLIREMADLDNEIKKIVKKPCDSGKIVNNIVNKFKMLEYNYMETLKSSLLVKPGSENEMLSLVEYQELNSRLIAIRERLEKEIGELEGISWNSKTSSKMM